MKYKISIKSKDTSIFGFTFSDSGSYVFSDATD